MNEERYAKPLPQLSEEAGALAGGVNEHFEEDGS